MRPIDETIEDIKRQAQLNRGKKITSCFLQDGDALVLKTDYLLRILEAINQSFPDMQYITSYARADSITRKNPAELKALRQAGLNHLYSGMETGSDRILKLINKGFDADTVVRSGCMAKDADMILSEFILLGIGGKEDPARLIFDGVTGDGIQVTMVDMGDHFRIICADIELVKQPKPMPKLPVARIMYRHKPNFQIGTAAWCYAGGAHHSVVSTALTRDDIAMFARLTGTELITIGEDTTEADLQKFFMK